jgi:hypothetical protein
LEYLAIRRRQRQHTDQALNAGVSHDKVLDRKLGNWIPLSGQSGSTSLPVVLSQEAARSTG